MSKGTTVKPTSLGYREVGSQADYTPLMGVLKGLVIGQDDPESTEIEAEFYDSPFDIFYDGNPVTMTFELANYELTDLPDLFGGEVDVNEDYEGAPNAFTSEHEWVLNFGRGHSALVIYRGLTIGTIKKDADGALNYSVTITALVYNDGTDDHMYKIVGKPWINPYPNARLYIDDDMYETPITIKENIPHIRFDIMHISNVPDSVTITATADGEEFEMTQNDDGWENEHLDPDLPLVIYANGVKWFTIINAD